MTSFSSSLSLSEAQQIEFTRQLNHAADMFELTLSQHHIKQLLHYLHLFIKWNKTYNLSAIRQPEDMLSKHLIDSLSLVALIAKDVNASEKKQRYIDVGTGGGLPGIPLAICLPQTPITLLDSAGKKMRFLFTVKQALGLDNVTIENRRVETFSPPILFDGVLSRAFASLKDMTSLCEHLLTSNGQFWAMKGVFPTDELRELEKHYIVVARHNLNVPGVEGERCVVVLKK